MREVDVALKKISVRRHNALAMRASLHGIQVEMIGESTELTPEDKEKIAINDRKAEDVLSEALRRKRAEVTHGIK
jgi:hypothetical protein